MSCQKRISTCCHLYLSLKETFWIPLGRANRKEAHPQLFKWIHAASRNQQVHYTCKRPITLHEAINTHTSFSSNHNEEGCVSCNGCRLINFFHFCLMRLALPGAFQRSRLLTFTVWCWDALALGPASHPTPAPPPPSPPPPPPPSTPPPVAAAPLCFRPSHVLQTLPTWGSTAALHPATM